LFSEEDEEYQLNVILNGLNTKSKLIHSIKILLNFLDLDLPEKAIKQNVAPNSHGVLEFQIHDNKISLKSKEVKTNIDFPINLLIQYKCNRFLEKFEENLNLEIPETTLQYYLSNGYATTGNSLKFSTISAGVKQSTVFSFKGKNSNNNQQSSRIIFNVKKFTQIIIVQMLNADNSILDSDSIKIFDLLYYFDEKNDFKHTLLFNNKPFVVLIRMNKAGVEEKKLQSEGQKSQVSSKMGDDKAKKEKSQILNEDNGGKKNKLSELDQLKLKIQNFKRENATLATQLIREQKIIVTKTKTIEELDSIINRAESTGSANFDKKKSKPLDQTKVNKARLLFNSICICGAPNPKFKGYCKDCLQKMKDEYDKVLTEYLPLNEKLENLSMKNLNHVTK